MPDTFTTLWKRLQLRASSIDSNLIRDFIRDSFNEITEVREWTWTMGHGTLYTPNVTVAGTVDVLNYSPFVSGTGTSFDASMIGKQIRLGSATNVAFPTYTIIDVPSPTTLVMDQAWVGPDLVNQQYQVFLCYFPVPEDFQYFVSLLNISCNYRLYTYVSEADFDRLDPQRTDTGTPYAAAFYDYQNQYQGKVNPIVQIIGTGQKPVSTTEGGYLYPQDSIYTLQIVTGGSIGTATFQWKQDGGTFQGPITTPDDGTYYGLNNGAGVYFPAGTYNAGDVFVFTAQAVASAGQKRFELWPRPINTGYVFPYIYRRVPPPLTDAQPQLPEPLARRGDVVLEKALAKCASWPGTDTMRNPYYDLQLARMHELKAAAMINELELKDDATASKNLMYSSLPYHTNAIVFDGNYLQRHDGPLITDWP